MAPDRLIPVRLRALAVLLALVHMPGIAQAERALSIARERWKGFDGPRTAPINEVTFVRESSDTHWTDLATYTLKPRK